MRTFISISPPTTLQPEIAALRAGIAETLDASGAPTRALGWSASEKAHLTLRFLGEMRAEQRASLTAHLREIAARHNPFTLELGGVGVFPNWRKPSVLWVGIGDSPLLRALQTQVEEGARSAGFAAETRSFAAHLTLARVKRDLAAEAARALGETIRTATQQPEIANWRQRFLVESMELMRSDLLPAGARYTVLERFALGQDQAG